jgi:hypothetical protein
MMLISAKKHKREGDTKETKKKGEHKDKKK